MDMLGFWDLTFPSSNIWLWEEKLRRVLFWTVCLSDWDLPLWNHMVSLLILLSQVNETHKTGIKKEQLQFGAYLFEHQTMISNSALQFLFCCPTIKKHHENLLALLPCPSSYVVLYSVHEQHSIPFFIILPPNNSQRPLIFLFNPLLQTANIITQHIIVYVCCVVFF